MAKHYDSEFKEYVSKLVVVEGRKAADVARELDISTKSLSRWVQAYKQQHSHSESNEKYLTPNEIEKLKKQHEKELRELREENEILKKAMHIFTKDQA
jgi:transposase